MTGRANMARRSGMVTRIEPERVIGIPGSPPDMAAPPSGCRFHPRCSQVRPFHKRLVPPLIEASPGHFVACHLYSSPDGPPDGDPK